MPDILTGWTAICPLRVPVPRHTDTVLSPREAQCLDLAAEGHSYAAIAQQLHISHNTVKGHFASIYKRWNVRCVTEAVMVHEWQRRRHA